MSNPLKDYVRKWIEDNREHLIDLSDQIWECAELGLIEHKSAKILSSELEKHGFQLELGVGGMPTAFVGVYGEGRPVIGIMGEYDALPGISQTKTPSKETLVPGAPGHGCGHNIHGVSGLAGAIALRYAMEEHGIQGSIKYFGTPAEESASGKVWMVRDGVFDGVDAVLSHHPGSVNYGSLASSLANNSIKFHFYGKTSHAAGSPEQGRSALDAIELMNVGVNYLREHVIQEARIHYIIEKGGGQPNVVPDYARSWYLYRAPHRTQVDHIHERILKIAEGASMMTETTFKVEFLKAIYNKVPSKTLSDIVHANMKEIGTPHYTQEELEFAKKVTSSISPQAKRDSLRKTKRPDWDKLVDVVMDRSIPEAWNDGEVSPGSTDVSDVSWKTPTMEFSTATWPLGTPGHSWMNVTFSAHSIGQKSLIFASKVLASSAVDLLTSPELIKTAWDEHKKRTLGKTYKSPVPAEARPPLNMWDK